MTELAAENLQKVYGGVVAVDDVSFSVSSGDALGIIGESGAGKSTLARLLVGLEAPDHGSIELDGQNMSSRTRSREQRRRIQMIFQDPLGSLNPRLSVADSIEDFLIIHRLGNASQRRQRLREVLEHVHLSESIASRRPAELSGGQRQRVCIARALAVKPDVLVADEPTSALDVSIQGQVLNLLYEERELHGLAVVIISHDIAVAHVTADAVAVMYGGQVVEVGPKEQVLTRPKHEYTARLLSAGRDGDRIRATQRPEP